MAVGPPGPVTPTLIAATALRRGVRVAPLLVVAVGALRGVDGGLSAGAGLLLAAANLLVAARSLDWAVGVSATVVAAVALGGYVVRLAVITALVLALGNLAWVDTPALAMTLPIAHLGLLSAQVGAR